MKRWSGGGGELIVRRDQYQSALVPTARPNDGLAAYEL